MQSTTLPAIALTPAAMPAIPDVQNQIDATVHWVKLAKAAGVEAA